MRALMRSINLPSHLATMGKEAEGSDTLMASFKNSTVLKDIEQMLVVLEQPEEEKDRNLQPYSDGGTPLDVEDILNSADAHEWHIPEGLEQRGTPLSAISPVRTSITSGVPKRPFAPRMRDSGVQTTASDDERLHSNNLPLGPEHSTEFSSSLPLQLPDSAWSLLEIYFSYTQCWFPILEKHDILRTAFQYTQGEVYTSRTTPGSGDHAALWAVLTFASLQDASIAVTRDSYSEPSVNSMQLYHTARGLIPSETGPYEVGHVQALLILSLIKFGQQEWTSAWMLVGHSVRIAQTLGLDQSIAPSKSQDQGRQAQQAPRAKHVFLGCFVLETLIAEQTSQCPSLRRDDLARVGTINEDGLEEWHPWEDQTGLRPPQSSRASMQRGPLHALSTFNRLVSLVAILNDLCCHKQDPTISRSQLELLEVHLQRWANAVPKSYRVDIQNYPSKSASPHIFGLEITYQSILSTLSLQIAERERDQNMPERPHRPIAQESCRRVLQLIQLYLDTYSTSSAPPTFGMIVKYCLSKQVPGDQVSEFELNLRNRIQSFSSHLGQLWSMLCRSNGSDLSQGVVISPPSQQGVLPGSDDLGMSHGLQQVNTPRHPPTSDPHASSAQNASTPDAFIHTPWIRGSQSIDDASLLPTPTPSLTTVGGASELSGQQGHLDGSLGTGVRPNTSAHSKPQNPSHMIADLSQPFPSNTQYPSYQDASIGLSPFVDMDGYGPPRRQQRIAPDLDALFDELASLDGAEK